MKQTIIENFKSLYPSVPRVFCAPGRVNLIGEHTDYNDGFVFPVAIDRRAYLGCALREDLLFNLYSKQRDEKLGYDLAAPTPQGKWGDYLFGVACVLKEKGFPLTGADLYLDSGIPMGSGMSSSAGVEVATMMALSTMNRLSLGPVEMARICQEAENRFVGTQCGIMDQFISVFGKEGHAVFLDCKTLEYAYAPLDPSLARLVVCNTMIKHELSSNEYNQRRKECQEGVRILRSLFPSVDSLRDASLDQIREASRRMGKKIEKRCLHVVSENERTLQARKFLEKKDMVSLGKAMDASHESLRMDYEVSCHELDWMVEMARGIAGTMGARMMGGGFGGCTINLVKPDFVDRFVREIEVRYREKSGILTQVYAVSPSDGAKEI